MKRTRRSLFKAGHQDANHQTICALLTRLGADPIDLSKVGSGCPDVLWGWQGQSVLFEIKTPDGMLTPSQIRWHNDWRGGPVFVVSSEADVLAAVEMLTRRTAVRAGVRG